MAAKKPTKPKKPLTPAQKAKNKKTRAIDKARARPAPGPGEIFQYRKHLDPRGKGLAEKGFGQQRNKLGTNAMGIRGDALDHLDPDTPTDPKTDTAAVKNELDVMRQLVDPRADTQVKNTTGHSIAAAASKREELWADGVQRAKLHGDVRRSDRPASTPELTREEEAYWNHPAMRPEKPHPLKPSETASHYGPLGADWYNEGGKDLRATAEMWDQDPVKFINASALQSPQNDPEGERRSATAMAEAVKRDYPITPINEEGATQLGIPFGDSINFNQLDSDVIARGQDQGGIANKKNAANFDTPVKLTEIAHGGTGKGDGLRAMRSDIEGSIDYGIPENHHQTQMDNMKSGKVPSYGVNLIDGAYADANDISEFNRRVKFVSGIPEHDDPNQMLLLDPKDPYGRAHSREGILDPEKTTAGDTWMRGVDFNLPNGERRLKSGQSVSKAIGSTARLTAMSVKGIYPTPTGKIPDESRPGKMKDEFPKVSAEQIRNAMSNEADIVAAENLSDRARSRAVLSRNTPVVKYGSQPEYLPVGLPPVAMQAASWTGTRIQSVNDPTVPKELREQSAGPAVSRLDHFAAAASVKPPPKRRGSPVQQGTKELSKGKSTVDMAGRPQTDRERAWSAGSPQREAARKANLPKTPRWDGDDLR
jgi:hypothetical protein